MAKNSYDINYEDKRFTQVKQEEKADLKESEKMYDGMINSSDSYYNKQIDAVENWGDKQAQLQQEQSDFTIEKIEQQKEQAHKDYLKEQSGAYVDWQKQSNQYGVNAEKQAENGLAFTGYSESSQVAMYNQYQNRVAMARESLNKAFLEYDNMMKDARLQNSAALAQIAFQTLQTTLELSLQGFQYKNQLILDKANAKANIKERSYNKYRDVLAQINTENALAEQVRQYNESLAEEKRQYNETMAYNKNKSSSSSRNNNNTVYGKLNDGGDDLKVEASAPSIEEQEKNSYSKALLQQIGMNRTVEGRVNTIQKLKEDGAITEPQAKELLEMFTD